MTVVNAVQNGFVRAVEAEYARRVVAYVGAGLRSQDAYPRALEEGKQLGLELLEELRHRGLFPWQDAEREEEGSPCVH